MSRTRNRTYIKDDFYPELKNPGSLYISEGAAIDASKAIEMKPYRSTVTDVMTDSVLPGYFKKKRDGVLLPTQPLSVTRQEFVPGYINLAGVSPFQNAWQSRTYKYRGVPNHLSIVPLNIPRGDIETLAQSAQARMASDGIDWATSALELGKTISMITGLRKSILQLITRILASLRNRRFKSFTELYDAFSSAWLEGRFGWRILYYELKSINDYLETIGEGHKKFFARETIKVDKTRTVLSSVYKDNFFDVTSKTTFEQKTTATVGYVGIGDLSKPGGFNVLNTVWEVIPFTVVLDMFFNIQDIILTWAPHASRVEAFQPGSFLTIKRETLATIEFDGTISPSLKQTVQMSSPGLWTNTVINRTSAPANPFSFDFKPELGGFKKVDLIAFMGPLYKAFLK